MYFIIYKTTNLVNGKFYVGAHQTTNLDDNYLGSGYRLRYAIRKYGRHSFNREILHILETSDEMYVKEAEIVTEEFIASPNTYNLKQGGIGLDSATARKNRESTNQKLREKYGDDWHAIISEKARTAAKQSLVELNKNPEFCEQRLKNAEKGRQAALSEESQQKRKNTMKIKGHGQGCKNNNFGKMWIYNVTTFENKTIIKTDPIPEGWTKGRKI